jgi:hypothetical protein
MAAPISAPVAAVFSAFAAWPAAAAIVSMLSCCSETRSWSCSVRNRSDRYAPGEWPPITAGALNERNSVTLFWKVAFFGNLIDVAKNIIAGIIANDEAVSLALVEPFYGSGDQGGAVLLARRWRIDHHQSPKPEGGVFA